MHDLIRQFRGMGVALVVLALSASVVFAGAPRMAPVADETTPPVETPSGDLETGDPGSPDPTTETPDADGDEDGQEGGDADDGADADDGETDAGVAAAGNHGELVSTAAGMDAPAGFDNHGRFVSCVARMGKDVVTASFDWTTVTAESCGYVTDAEGAEDADSEGPKETGKAKGKEKAEAGKAKGQAGKAKAKSKSGR